MSYAASAASAEAASPPGAGFAAQVESTKPILETLAGVHNGKADQHMVCEVDETGVVCKVHDLGFNIQGQASLYASLFEEFEVDGDGAGPGVAFKINVGILLKCLNVYGSTALSTTTTAMQYDADTAEFRLLLQPATGGQKQQQTQCRIKTLSEGDDALADAGNDLFALLEQSEPAGKCIILSDALCDTFAEIYALPGAASVSLLMSPRAPYLQLSAQGTTSQCTIEFPKGSESFKSFECDRVCRHSYQLSLIQDALKVLPSADRTNIHMHANGLLCFQHRLQHANGQSSFVEFVVLPEEADSDDEEEEEEDGDGGGKAGGGQHPRDSDDMVMGDADEDAVGVGGRGRRSMRKKRKRKRHPAAGGQVESSSALFDDPFRFTDDDGSQRQPRQRQQRKQDSDSEQSVCGGSQSEELSSDDDDDDDDDGGTTGGEMDEEDSDDGATQARDSQELQ